AHPPPRGALDRVFSRFHAGSDGLRRIVTRHRIPILLCGHIHEQPGVERMEETLVINCSIGRKGAGALIDCAEGQKPRVEMLKE
ncbi:MAG: phosphoesterase, partial [Thermodesulfobacteriota bacterium]